MIFEKIAQAQSFEEAHDILIRTHVLLGGRARPDLKELSSTLAMAVTQMVMRPTFEHDFVVLLEKIHRYLESNNRYDRADMAERVFNTTAICAPEQYCFVVNTWQSMAAPTFVKELEASLWYLVDKGIDTATAIAWIDEFSQLRPDLWDYIKQRTFQAATNIDYSRHVQLLLDSNHINNDEVAVVFNKMSEVLHGAGRLGGKEREFVKKLIVKHSITLETFIDQMYAFAENKEKDKCVTKEFLDLLRDFTNNPEAPSPIYPNSQKAVLESLIDVFGLQYSPKYNQGLCAFKKCYKPDDKIREEVQEWLTKIPYQEALHETHAQSNMAKKKSM